MRRIVILGSGFAGLHAAQYLSDELSSRRRLDVTMITDRSHFLFTPLWTSVATGTSKLSQAAIPLTKLLDDPVGLVVDRVTTIDLEQREVVGERNRYPYDFLLLAVGGTTHWRGKPGFEETTLPCKSGRDAVDAIEALTDALRRAGEAETSAERRGALTFTVAGGGPTGVELMARIASHFELELRDTLPPELANEVRLVLVEPQKRLLPDLDEDLGPIALDHLRGAGVEIRLGESVVECTRERVELSSGDAFACESTFWCGGVRPPQWLGDAGFETDGLGRVLVGRHLQVVGQHGVYAAGDVAGADAPMDADVAVSQAVVAASNIVADLSGRSRRQWEYEPYGTFVSLGRSNAAVKFRGVVLQGRPAQAVWGGAYSRLLPSALQRLAMIPDLFGDAFSARGPSDTKLLPE